MAGGGTGGHVIPSVAVAGELRQLGHDVLFVGTRRGMEATIVPRAGYPMEWIEIGGLQRVSWKQTLKTSWQLPWSVLKSAWVLKKHKTAAVFSMGGYVAAPVMMAASAMGIPMVAMEPNALPGLVTRKMAGRVQRALVSFEETEKYFPPGRTVRTGLPVRGEFFAIQDKVPVRTLSILITGGSRGAKALNKAARESWPFFRRSGLSVRMVLQCGADEYDSLAREFNETQLDGEVVAYLHDMPAAYAAADLVVSRSGAGAVSELAAAGKPSVLVPFPFAADDHQRHNAEAMARAGAAQVCLESEWSGERFFDVVGQLSGNPERLRAMGAAARKLAKPGAARKAAEILLELALRS
ncbi:MAG: undecaprenyldiphospho-muramoylpentapeptide beta-N-acetylglucosaminyltransferase [Acidobacteria bacterium]|nr:undecaprenyldiphospho-muramoylpentapeptide beta-N-acetylglucosaminyltransferase [Acidobacteriota bacterium]